MKMNLFAEHTKIRFDREAKGDSEMAYEGWFSSCYSLTSTILLII